MLPHRAFTNIDIIKYAKAFKISYFRGVFMKNGLPITGLRKNESAIVNLEDKDGAGTHWVAYKKRLNDVIYFDSFGDLKPLQELINYLGVGSIKYNYEKYQNYNTIVCGHLCLKFLASKRL